MSEKDVFESGGIGHYMADYLAKRLHRSYMSIYECVTIGAYILSQAKEHVSGCGGASQIGVLKHDGNSGVVNSAKINQITEMMHDVDGVLGEVMLKCADLRVKNEQEFSKSIDVNMTSLHAVRSSHIDSVMEQDKSKAFFHKLIGRKTELQYDDLGICRSPDPQLVDFIRKGLADESSEQTLAQEGE